MIMLIVVINIINLLECLIDKKDEKKVTFNGNYCIYILEGYSFNPKKLSLNQIAKI